MAERDIVLYTGQSPNGIKISITLEELGLPYTVRKLDMSKNEQKSDWFCQINPNGRIPAIELTHHDGKRLQVFESGAIMQFLVNEFDDDHKISYPPGTREQIEMTNWLFFQNAGIGPMQGQINHFKRYAPEKIEYAIGRYTNEVKRLYGVLDKHLRDAGTEFLVGNKCTIADISCWGWITLSRWSGVELTDFPTLQKWEELMFARPAVQRGRQVPDKHQRELLQDPEAVAAFEEKARGFYRQQEKDAMKTREGV